MLRGFGSWLRSKPGRISVAAVVLLMTAAVAFVVTRGGSNQPNPAQVSPNPAQVSGVSQGHLQAGAFTPVPGSYDPGLLAVFPAQPFQAAFGVRPPSAPSRAGYQLVAAIGATGLLRVTTADGAVVALNLLPVPDGFTLASTTTGFQSTAVALIALTPGLLSDQPYADMLVDREISVLPETGTVIDALVQAAKAEGVTYLAHPPAAVLAAVSTAVHALLTHLTSDAAAIKANPQTVLQPAIPAPSVSTAAWERVVSLGLGGVYDAASNPLPPSCDGPSFSSVGGLEGDDICLAGIADTVSGVTESLAVRAVNRAPRWALLYPTTGGGAFPLGIIEPKAWSIPGVADLLSAIADAVANSSDVNAAKQAAGWLSGVAGATYHPYLGGDDFPTQLGIQIRRFAHNTVSAFSFTPDASRSVLTTTFGLPRSDDPGAPNPGSRAITPALMTIVTQIFRPVALIFLDVKSVASSLSGPPVGSPAPSASPTPAPTVRPTATAHPPTATAHSTPTPSSTLVKLGVQCPAAYQVGYTSKHELLECSLATGTRTWQYPQLDQTCPTQGLTATTATRAPLSCQPNLINGPLVWQKAGAASGTQSSTLTNPANPSASPSADGSPAASPNAPPSGSDPGASTSHDCLDAYLRLGLALTDPLTTLLSQLTGKQTGDVVSTLGTVATATFTDLDTISCVFSSTLFNAATEGALGDAAQKAAETLIAHGITTLQQALGLFKSGQSVSGLAASEIQRLEQSIVGSIAQTVIGNIVKRIAALAIPGGDLLVAVQIAQQASDITGLVLGLADLASTALSFGAGSTYTVDGTDAIAAELVDYPRSISPDTAGVSYTPEYYGNADTVTMAVGGTSLPGFWVSGQGHADVFAADSHAAYTISAASEQAGSLTVSRTASSVGTSWSTKVNDVVGGAVHLVIDDKTGNFATYRTQTGQGATDIKVFSVATGTELADVDGQIKAANLSAFRGEFWQVAGLGNMLISGLNGPSGPSVWALDFSTGAGRPLPGPSGAPQAGWKHLGTAFWGFDDAKVYPESGSGLKPVYALSATPAARPTGVSDLQCGNTLTYATDDGFVVRDDTFGHNVWKSHVDPSQGWGQGNRALFTAELAAPGCDTIAADDHGVVTRFDANGGSRWTSRYGYADTSSGTDAPYPISGLAVDSGLALVVSNYDPHLVGFRLANGDRVFSYPLDTETVFLDRLSNGFVLAIGTTGHLSVLALG
jgi:hypothetical protein